MYYSSHSKIASIDPGTSAATGFPGVPILDLINRYVRASWYLYTNQEQSSSVLIHFFRNICSFHEEIPNSVPGANEEEVTIFGMERKIIGLCLEHSSYLKWQSTLFASTLDVVNFIILCLNTKSFPKIWCARSHIRVLWRSPSKAREVT